MKHIKLIKAAIKIMFFASAAYILLGVIFYIFSKSLQSTLPLLYSAASMGLWTGAATLVITSITWIICQAGLNKTGSARPFICAQLLFLCAACNYFGEWLSVIIMILLLIAGGNIYYLPDKFLFILYYLPALVTMVMMTVCLFFYYRENLSVSGVDLPSNPYARRNRKLAAWKTAVVTAETVAVFGYYCYIFVMAVLV